MGNIFTSVTIDVNIPGPLIGLFRLFLEIYPFGFNCCSNDAIDVNREREKIRERERENR